jgi:hypothetical protein
VKGSTQKEILNGHAECKVKTSDFEKYLLLFEQNWQM